MSGVGLAARQGGVPLAAAGGAGQAGDGQVRADTPLQYRLFTPEIQWQPRGKSQSFFRLLLRYSGNPGTTGVSYRGASTRL
jgi:hypothetical protein